MSGKLWDKRILVLGLGPWGMEVVDQLALRGADRLTRVAVGERAPDLERTAADRWVALRPNGLATPSRDPHASALDEHALLEFIASSFWVIVVADVEGPRWGELALWVALQARTRGALVTSVIVESARRRRPGPRPGLDATILIPTGRESATVAADGIHWTTALLLHHGYIGFSLEDIQAVLGHGGTARVGFGRAVGRDRCPMAMAWARQAVARQGVDLEAPCGYLVNIVGRADLSLQEVNDGLTLLHEQASSKSEISFSSQVDEALEAEVIVTLLVCPAALS